MRRKTSTKIYRLNFTRGVNRIGDKAILPDGFITVGDNVDLRSGTPKPFKMPEYKFVAPTGTTRSWSYRGRWFHSANWRDYVGEYIGGIERVYATEEGKYPTKTVNGITVNLGTPRPTTPLAVARTTDLTPSGFVATINYDGTGNLPDGGRYYRISGRNEDGILPPSAPIVVNIADTAHKGASVKLTWGQLPKITGYVLFEGDLSDQYRLVDLPPSATSFLDTGSRSASGDAATQYQNLQEFEYVYSYVRNVGGVFNESGLSALSIPVSSSTGRTVVRNYLNDGFFDQIDSAGNALAISGTGTISNTSSTSYPAKDISGTLVTLDPVTLMVKFFAFLAHGFISGDKVQFQNFKDPAWNNITYEVIRIDANNFAIKSGAVPSDGPSLPIGCLAQPLKTLVSYTASAIVNTDDLVYLSGTATGQTIKDLYKATYVSDISFTVPLLTSVAPIALTTVKWVPKNGYYWRWNLYRNDSGSWQLVEELTLDVSSYSDAKPSNSLGAVPTSYYNDNGITVDFDKAPLGLTNIESHYGMLFGIIGHTVRWTPALSPDAWPEVFSLTFAYQPVALASYSQGIIVLCEDAIYRIDGNESTSLSQSKTLAEDGCFAPHSVQKTDRGLLYLSKRGIMMFSGTYAECLTDTKVNGDFFISPSSLVTPYPFWWFPTIMTRNYADLAGEDSIRGDSYYFTLDNTRVIEGYNKAIRSMYHIGKYYLFHTGSNYQANTGVYIDLQLPEYPLFSLGLKVLDCHVDEYENAHVLLNNAPPQTTVTITAPL